MNLRESSSLPRWFTLAIRPFMILHWWKDSAALSPLILEISSYNVVSYFSKFRKDFTKKFSIDSFYFCNFELEPLFLD